MFRITRIVLLSTGLVVTHCSPPPPKDPGVVTIAESFTGVTDISPPSRLDVIMNLGGSTQEVYTRCQEMGGTLHQHKGVWICEGVGY